MIDTASQTRRAAFRPLRFYFIIKTRTLPPREAGANCLIKDIGEFELEPSVDKLGGSMWLRSYDVIRIRLEPVKTPRRVEAGLSENPPLPSSSP